VRARSRTGGFRLEEVPPYLPLPWFKTYFADLVNQLPGVTFKLTRHLRRAASLRLAELACGEAWPRCAIALGKPEQSGTYTLNVLGHRLNDANLWPRFEDAAGYVADALGQLPDRVDFANRRSALSQWRLSKNDWEALCSGIPRLEKMSSKCDPGVGTILAWSHANEAEYLHHPLLDAPRQVHIGTKDSLSHFVGRFYHKRSHQQGGRLVLRRRLDLYGARLAVACDHGGDLRVSVAEVIAGVRD
jgi:hypothetical protein